MTYCCHDAGWSERTLVAAAFWRERVVQAVQEPDPALQPLKVFKPKISLPPVSDYRREQSPQFWEKFPENTALVGVSPINPVRLRSWANAVGCDDRTRLDLVCRDLENGADIGCRGRAREPTFSGNAPSAVEAGAQVTDALAEWVQQGIVAGPFPPERRPKNAKVNGIMCRMKPNGTARIIVNLSVPKGKVLVGFNFKSGFIVSFIVFHFFRFKRFFASLLNWF
jgi:hypothetical protein